MKNILLLLSLILPQTLLASMESDARGICEKAMKHKNNKNKYATPEMCQSNRNSPDYWNCVLKQMDKGDSLEYSTEHCGEKKG